MIRLSPASAAKAVVAEDVMTETVAAETAKHRQELPDRNRLNGDCLSAIQHFRPRRFFIVPVPIPFSAAGFCLRARYCPVFALPHCRLAAERDQNRRRKKDGSG